MASRRPAPGPEDFRQLRMEGHYYVDKSGFIQQVLNRGEQVILLPRPRRFGKTLNLSMLRYYLERSAQDRRGLFAGLAIEAAGPDITYHQGRYPLFHVSFKDVKAGDWTGCLEGIRRKLAEACQHHLQLRSHLTGSDLDDFERLLSRRVGVDELSGSLLWMSRWLAGQHGERTVLLIDEYDAPIEAGYLNGYYEQVVQFMRNMLGAGLKTNEYLFKGVLTGVQRISRDSLFSGLNNPAVFTVLDEQFNSAFGFDEDEVRTIVEAAGRAAQLSELRHWYNGYVFGGRIVYNPWSVLSYAARGQLKSYWAATGGDDVIRTRLLASGGIDLNQQVNALIAGEGLDMLIDDSVAFRDLDIKPSAIWSLLLFAGYLSATNIEHTPTGLLARLAIPNSEVRGVWKGLFATWLEQRMRDASRLSTLTQALLHGDGALFEDLLSELVESVLSFHDTGAGPAAPERVYHAFALGLLTYLEPRYRVRSERESGFGRSDVLILPTEPGRPGAVLEFKLINDRRGETPEEALDAAMAQIIDRDYDAELRAAGAAPRWRYAVAFSGKRVWVRVLPAQSR